MKNSASDSGSLTSSVAGVTRPVHVDVKPRDSYQHRVTVEKAGDAITFSFFTRRKNISFGLFYLHVHAAGGSASLKGSTASVSGTGRPLDSAEVREIIGASKSLASIEPGPMVMGKDVRHSTRSDGGDEASLSRSHTVDSRFSSTGSMSQEHRSSSTASISAFNSTEMYEIVPIAKYPSFEHTIHGKYVTPLPGTYILYFDNSFSIKNSKELFLTVSAGAMLPIKEKDEGTFSGWLLKKKQRRLQGWARRWFELSQKGILSYFEDRFSPCRGSVNVHQCTITKIPQRLLITVDSGEVTYHLRALSEEDYKEWSERLHSILALSLSPLESPPTGADSQAGAVPVFQRPSMIAFTEDITEKLRQSEKYLADIRALASTEDPSASATNFISPLEMAFQSLSDLYETLADYSVFLQRTSRRMSTVAQGMRGAGLATTDLTMDEFYDAQEITLSEVSESEIASEMLSLEELTISPTESEEQMEFLEALEELPPISETMLRAKTPSTGFGSPVYEGQVIPYRKRLPCVAPEINFSILSILKNNIGKDWTTISMPVAANEPIGFLQRLCEELEYSHLLDKASMCESPIDRLILVATFIVSGWSSSVHRSDRKPFTPILGETFEYIRADGGCRFLAEKISHRPLLNACFAQSPHWEFHQDQKAKNKFWGKSMEFIPQHNSHIRFPRTGDLIIYNKPTLCLRNVLSNNRWVDIYGDVMVRNITTGDVIKLTFKPDGGFFSSSGTNRANEVIGAIYPAGSRTPSNIVLRGRWDSMFCKYVEGSAAAPEVLWRANPVPNDHLEYYGMGEYAISLNDLVSEEHKALLPPTDTRLRPDQRLLEVGKLDEAEAEKVRIEQKQRDIRRQYEEEGKQWTPTWFEYHPPTDNYPEGCWRIKDPEAYWKHRSTGQGPSLPDIF